MPKVSIIIPVYNVEKYIGQCARSLFEQTLEEIEYIFIDDCTPDDSILILKNALKEYPNRTHQVLIIRNSHNKGVAASRQAGVQIAKGEYIIHCDPDDWVESRMYEQMYNVAIKKHADIVYCNYIKETHKGNYIIQQDLQTDKYGLLLDIYEGKVQTYLWNFLISREYLVKNNISFNPYLCLWEDMAYLIPLFLKNGNFIKLNFAFYHYRYVSNSISHTITSTKIKSMISATDDILNYIESLPDKSENKKIMQLFQLKAKASYLEKGNNFNLNMWRQIYPASNKNIWILPIPIKRKVFYSLCNLQIDIIVAWLKRYNKK